MANSKDASKTVDEFAAEVFRTAWVGLKKRYATDQARLKRASDYYVNRLREATTLADTRGPIAELCAEAGPIPELGQDGLRLFWGHLEKDWRKVRDIALMTSAI